MNRLGIEMLSALGTGPVDYINLAADLGCAHVSIGLGQLPINPYGHPPFDLATDAALRREVIAAMRDRGVSISLGEGFVVREGFDIRDAAAAQFGPMLDLGVQRINVVSMDPDLPRTLDQYAVLAELASDAGFAQIVCEFAPVLTIRDLPMALEAVAHVGRDNFRLLIDTMHLGRTGGTGADLAALDPDLIAYVQLSDAPMESEQDYMQESMTDRMGPGEGELPVRDMLAAIPRDRVVSLEVPQMAKALAGKSALEILQPVVSATRDMLVSLPDA